MNTTSNTTLEKNTTSDIEIDMDDYYPSVKLFMNKKGDIERYIPVSLERNLVKYDISVIRSYRHDGSLTPGMFVIKIDYSKNIIKCGRIFV